MNQPRYYASDFEPPEASPALQFFCGVFIAACALACGVMAGYEWRDFLAREEARAAKLKPRPTVQRHDPLAKYCAAPKEFVWVCKQRRTAI